MKYQARNIYMAVVSAVGFCLLVNSLIHFNFSKTPETLILALYYIVSMQFEVFLFGKNCHFFISGPLHLLAILLLGYQGAVSLVLGYSIMNFRLWRRNQVSFFCGFIFASLYFVPALYLANLFLKVTTNFNQFNTLSEAPYMAIAEAGFLLLSYGLFMFALIVYSNNKRKIHLDFVLLCLLDYSFFILAIIIYRCYQYAHLPGLLLCLLPFSGFAYLWQLLIKRFFEKKEELSAALAISDELIESGLDMKTMAKRVTEKIQNIFEAAAVEIFLKNQGAWEMQIAFGSSPWLDRQPELNFLLCVQNILPQGPTTLYGSSLNEAGKRYKDLGFNSLLIIPLISNEEHFGFIICASNSIFDPTHEFFGKKLIHSLSTALISAQLHDRLSATLKELHATKEQLLHFEKMEAIGKLTAGIAHEFNTPLSTLLIKIEALKEIFYRLPEKSHLQLIKETCSVFESQIDRLTTIVDNLRCFAKEEELKETWSYVNLNAIFEELLKNSSRFIARDIQFHIDLPELPQLWGVPLQIYQLFERILSNALLAIQGKGDIWIAGYQENQKIIISIRDNGAGMPQKIQHRIFDPFFTTRDIGEGNGLGLSVAYGIMQRHSGEITFESQEGVGTTFYLVFPQSQLLYLNV